MIDHLVMDCCVWISWLMMLSNPLTRMDIEMSKATLYNQEQYYEKSLRNFSHFEKVVLAAHRKRKLPAGFLDWTYRLQYNAGPLEKKLIELERKIESPPQ